MLARRGCEMSGADYEVKSANFTAKDRLVCEFIGFPRCQCRASGAARLLACKCHTAAAMRTTTRTLGPLIAPFVLALARETGRRTNASSSPPL